MTLIILFQFILTLSANENSLLSLEMVLNSSQEHFPKILEAVENYNASQMKVREARGQFDLKLKSKIDKRTDGFYDGSSADVVISKPLQYLNSEIYTGYRVSEGNYPDYEGKFDTLNNGEYRGGVKVSLWQNAFIDKNRLKLWNSELDVDSKEFKLLMTRVKVQKKATKAYWQWVAKGNIYNVYKNLLAIAEKRDEAIQKKVKKGDLAAIYRTENQQYIVKRKTQVATAYNEFQNATIYLSLFHRDDKGRPISPELSQLPEAISGEKKISINDLQNDLLEAMKLSPELKTIQAVIEQQKNQESFGRNKLMPKVDLKFEVSKDYGGGSKTLKTTENRAMLSIEIPIERNLGKGIQRQARAKQMALDHQRKLMQEKMKVIVQSLFYELNTSVEVIENTKLEMDFALTLQKAEYEKFSQGASDFFVVNIREQNLADAKIKNIKAHLNYQKAIAEYNASTFQILRPTKKM